MREGIRAVVLDAAVLAARLQSGSAAAELEALHLLLLGGVAAAVIVQADTAADAAQLTAVLRGAGLPPGVRVHTALWAGLPAALRAAAESMGVAPQHCACLAAGEARQAMQTASQCAGMPMVCLDDAHDLGASGAAAPGALGGLAARVAQSQRGVGALLVGVVARPARFRQLAERGLFPLVALDGVSFLRLDLGAPLDVQGRYDAVLVKASDELECNESGAAPCLSARLRAVEPRLQAQHVRVIDSLPAISQVLDRWTLHSALQRVQAAAAARGLPLRVPATARLEAVGAGAAAALAGQGVRFPLVLKPVVACGAPQAHRMALLAAPHGLNGAAAVPLPAVAQAFVAHGGIAHKVYVLGRAVRVSVRASLPDLPAPAGARGPAQEQPAAAALVFDSQHMAHAAGGSAAPAAQPPLDRALVDQAAALLRQELRLWLFGFDVLVESASGVHYIVDVNHFPSYSDVPDAASALRAAVKDAQQQGP